MQAEFIIPFRCIFLNLSIPLSLPKTPHKCGAIVKKLYSRSQPKPEVRVETTLSWHQLLSLRCWVNAHLKQLIAGALACLSWQIKCNYSLKLYSNSINYQVVSTYSGRGKGVFELHLQYFSIQLQLHYWCEMQNNFSWIRYDLTLTFGL